MGNRGQTISESQWESLEKQLRALHKDWHYLYKLIEGYAQSRFERRELEVAFLDLKGRISCDYPVLAQWRAENHGVQGEIGAFFEHGATLKSLAEDFQNGTGRTRDEWELVDGALGYIRQLLEEARAKARPGKPIRLPREFFHPHVSGQEIDKYTRQFTAFRADWRRIYELVEASMRPGADRRALESELMQIRSKLSCDYPTLPRWFGGRDEIAKGIDSILSNGTSLDALSEGIRRGGRIGRDWAAVDTTVGTVCSELGRVRTQLQNGKATAVVDDFFTPPGRRRVSLETLLKRIAICALAAFLVFTVYVMRNYLGYWAPDAGEGIEVNASLEDAEKLDAILSVATQSCRDGDVDLFMATIARDFSDDEGNGRRALRVIVQAYNTAGRMQHAWFDWKRAQITRKEEWIYAQPVLLRSDLEDEEVIPLRLGLKQYGERWLIAYAEGHN